MKYSSVSCHASCLTSWKRKQITATTGGIPYTEIVIFAYLVIGLLLTSPYQSQSYHYLSTYVHFILNHEPSHLFLSLIVSNYDYNFTTIIDKLISVSQEQIEFINSCSSRAKFVRQKWISCSPYAAHAQIVFSHHTDRPSDILLTAHS